LRQQVAESGRTTPPPNAAAEKRLADLRDENKRLTEQVALLKRSADDASSAIATRSDTAAQDTITRLKNELAAAEKAKETLAADKKRAEDEAQALKQRADDLAATASTTTTSSATAAAENRSLRLQIEKITGQYNDLSAKLTASEQHARSIEEDLDKLRSLQPATKDAANGGFSDLSDEIKKMQDVIDAQKRFIVKRDTEINSLTEQNLRLQNQVGGKPSSDTSRQLIEELNQELKAREERIALLNSELEKARIGDASTVAPVSASLPATTPVPNTASVAPAASGASLPGSTPTTRPAPDASGASLPGSTPTTRAVASAPAPVSKLPKGTRTYRVQSGDTLGKIAEKAYGDKSKWMQILNYNREQLPTVSALRVGMNLYIPPQP
jgi:nucleoid-associated protein YgaU